MTFKMAMWAVCLISCVSIVIAGQPPIRAGLDVKITPNAGYDVVVNGKLWLRSAPTQLQSGGIIFNTDDYSLQLQDTRSDTGKDSLGRWSETIFDFLPMGVTKSFTATVRVYWDEPIVLFGQYFPDGMDDMTTADIDRVVTYFPSFQILDPTTWDAGALGYLAYGGIMFGDTAKTTGVWSSTTVKPIMSGADSGPLVLFAKDSNDSIVISPFSQFMAMSAAYEFPGGVNGNSDTKVSWGVMGAVDSIPRRFHAWTSITYSDKGVNGAMDVWGDIMRRQYHKDPSYRNSDVTVNYLGYWTDNGAYYYLNNTETGLNYQDTLLDVKHYADQLDIPYRYVQYDAWFYPLGPRNGTLSWSDLPSVFPDGLQHMWDLSSWPIIAHNRWWSDKVTYARQNGGNYDWVVDELAWMSLPLEQRFWDDLLADAKKWGLLVYEQDFLNFPCDQMESTSSDVYLGRRWLRQMGNAAARVGLTIQYCMSPSRTSLQSVEIPVVTQARVSNDYHPGGDNWKIGFSSMFAHAMGVAPFKDNFWTSTDQPGNPYESAKEPYPALNALVATLSTGPVGPSDKIGTTDRQLIMRSCNIDGLILKPSRPATAINKQLTETVFNGFKGEVWSTWSLVSGHVFGTVFAADMMDNDTIQVSPSEAGFGEQFAYSGIYSYHTPSTVAVFSEAKPLQLKGCSKANFCLYHTTPLLAMGRSNVLLLGETTKWVPMSPKRVTSLSVSDYDIKVRLTGAARELVTFTVIQGDGHGHDVVHQHMCRLSKAGLAELSVATNTCQ